MEKRKKQIFCSLGQVINSFRDLYVCMIGIQITELYILYTGLQFVRNLTLKMKFKPNQHLYMEYKKRANSFTNIFFFLTTNKNLFGLESSKTIHNKQKFSIDL